MIRILIFFISLILLTSCSWEFLPPSQDIESHDYVHVFEAKNGFEIVFDSGTTKTVSEYHTSGSIILNGSYFWVTEKRVYYPAGLWVENGIEKSPMNMTDPNLSHIVYKNNWGIYIYPNHYWVSKTKSTWSFIDGQFSAEDSAIQAWPLVLSGNILQPLWDSWHARGPHERTLIGKTQSGKVYFFIFEKPVTLPQVADIIVQDDRFAIDPITLLNLDGWPSTAYYDGENGFRENAKLPIIFRIREQ